MKTVGFTLLIALALALSGCNKDEGGDKGGGEGSGSATGGDEGGDKAGGDEGGDKAGGDEGGDKAGDDGLANKMKNCPSAIEGAKTTIEVKDGKIMVAIEVGEGHIDDAVSRVKHMQGLDINEPEEVKHSGEGTGGGRGPCPLVTTMSKIEKFEAAGGTLNVTVVAAKAEDTDKVAGMLKERADELAKKMAGGGTHDGSGKGGGTGGGGGDGSGGGEGDSTGGGDKGGDTAAKKDKPKPKKDEGGW